MGASALVLERRERLRLRVRGVVQGVGFRPFAFGLASRLGLSGFVRNDAEGVLIEVEGARAETFLTELNAAPPPLARIDSVEAATIAALGGEGFVIDATRQGRTMTRIGPDAAVCDACLEELFDPASRFFALSPDQLHAVRPALYAHARSPL